MSCSIAQRTRDWSSNDALYYTIHGPHDGFRWLGLMSLVGGFVGLRAGTALVRCGAFDILGDRRLRTLVMLSSKVLLSMVAIVAGFLPVFRTYKVEPITALRHE
jgi:hypothetical protein